MVEFIESFVLVTRMYADEIGRSCGVGLMFS